MKRGESITKFLPEVLATEPLILSDRPDSCAGQLQRALHSAIPIIPPIIPYDRLALTHHGIELDDKIIQPAFVLARFIAKGSLEAITHKLSLLHALKARGVPVINDPTAIEATVDKGMCASLLHHHRIPTPPHITTHNYERARAFIRKQNHRCILKPLLGARGEDMRLIDHEDDLPPHDMGEVFHLQRFIPSSTDDARCRDWRVFVIDGKAVACIERENDGWRANISLGGEARARRHEAVESLAQKALACTSAFYGGVDIIVPHDDPHHPLVLEINSIPAWRGIHEATDIAIPSLLAHAIVTSAHASH